MEKEKQNGEIIQKTDCNMCDGADLLCLWGSAFPCVKIGYELLQIKTTGSQILFAGYRFFGAGILTFLMGCIIEKRVLT